MHTWTWVRIYVHRGTYMHTYSDVRTYVQKCFANMYVAMLDFGQEWKGTGFDGIVSHKYIHESNHTRVLCVPHSTQRVSGCGVVATLLPM